MNIVYQTKAETDLEGIIRYSLDRFGEHKAIEYWEGIKHQIEKVANGEGVSFKCDDIKKGLLKTKYMSHDIYYITKAENLIIIRILHNAMLAKRKLQ